ncbi:MAG TPA: FecR domain-containing protein, partial [Planctomycetota bacterium]|nr:FecR domain-containing protein [Planctomycetota bacterium]
GSSPAGRPRTISIGWAAGLLGVAAFVGIIFWRGSTEPTEDLVGASVLAVEEVQGTVYRSRPGMPRGPVHAKDRIAEGESLDTAGDRSRILLRYSDGTRLALEEHSVLKELGEGAPGGKRMFLGQGALHLVVAPQPPTHPLVVRTPQGQAQVVGTAFGLRVDSESGGRTRLEVEEGRVKLSRPDGTSIEVSGGFYAVAGAGVELVAHASIPPPKPGTWKNLMDSFIPPVSLDARDFKSQNYGMQTLALCAGHPNVLYVGTCYQGIYKSIDGGDHWVRINSGVNGANLETGRNWTLAVDPVNSDVVYTVAGGGVGQGIWKSTNGGVDWSQMMDSSLFQQTTADVYCISIDPANPRHLLVGFHSGWASGNDAGVLESADAGTTWIAHPPRPGWGSGHYAFFIDSVTWILATEGNGIWRTADSGRAWTQVDSQHHLQHGAGQLYQAANGALYLGAVGHLLRSTDQGRSWNPVGLPPTSDGYNAIVGDGIYLYAQPANTGGASGPPSPYYVSPETDGLSWSPYNAQTFSDGPMSLVADRAGRIVYSSNWRAGVWRLIVPR